jgi:flagellar protein FliJ
MAGRFRFNLQRVLEYREQLEEQAKLALAGALRAVKEQKGRIDALVEAVKENEQAILKKKTVTPAEMWLYRTYKERLLQDVAQARNRLEALKQELNKRRTEAVARSKERKLLEKLKSNQAVNYAREESLKEQNGFDEMATIRYEPKVL